MKNILIRKFFAVGLLLAGACTDLDEEDLLYDTVTTKTFYKNDQELLSAIGGAYSNLYGAFGSSSHIWPAYEVTSDEIVVPTRGADWGDGGHWVRLKLHTYTPQDPVPRDAWNFLYRGINTCNRVLATLEPLGTDVSKAYIAELKALRATYYYWLLDLYGNVPLSIDATATEAPGNSTRQEVYNFVEKELLENMDLLQKTGPADEATYGRVNYYTAQTVLAKLYLNAQVYTGTPRWDEAIAACDAVINSGKYALMANYRDNFKKDNKGSTEFIWAIPYDEIQATGFTMPHITLHMASQSQLNMSAQPWNGFASVQEFYQSYIDPAQNPGPQGTVIGLDPAGTPTTGTVDERLTNFIVGPQKFPNGSLVLDGGADPADPNGPPITFTPYINELQPNAWRQSGARIGKWEIYSGNNGNLSNDYAIFRYADVLLMRAEAVARKTGNWNDPYTLAIVNQIRTEHGSVDPFTDVTEDKFLAERGREMFAEAFRRQDLLRFGRYNNAWRFHPADPSPHVNLFPIPETQINANNKLKQNPGY
jgi:starch-binding outer membrane protein, SusD/RagB family